MKSIFEETTRDEISNRINSLSENSKRQWGKMSVSQMMKHCTQWDDMALGKRKYKQVLIGKIFGKIALKDILKDKAMKKNMPTVPSFKINEAVDFSEEKMRWSKLLEEYAHFSNDGFIHPFFGWMTKEQTGYLVYKHADHHLKQFNS